MDAGGRATQEAVAGGLGGIFQNPAPATQKTESGQ